MADRRVTFLLVEDNPLDVITFEHECAETRFEHPIVHAEHGGKALDLIKGTDRAAPLPRPLIVLLDISMPAIDGHQFLDRLRSDPATADLPVMVLTTSNSKVDRERAFGRHVAGYFVKSNKEGELARQIAFFDSYAKLSALPA